LHVTENVAKLSFASERIHTTEHAHNFVVDLSSNDFNRRQGVAMSITVSISAIQTHAPDIDADEMSNSRHSPLLISVSVGVDYPCCGKPQRSLCNFSLTGTIFLSIPSHFARIQSSRWQYFTSTNHL